MGFDPSVKRVTSSIKKFKTSSTPLIPQARPGDVVIAPKVFNHNALTSDEGVLSVKTITASSIRVADQDLETLITNGETNRLVPNVVTNSNIAIGGITTTKLSAPIPVSLGGTGLEITSAEQGMIVVGNGSNEISLSSQLTWSDVDDTLHVARAVNIQEFTISSSNASLHLTTSGVNIDLMDYSLGLAPVLTLTESNPSSAESEAVIDYAITSGDADPIYLHIAWYLKSTDQPRLPIDVRNGTGAISTDQINLQSPGFGLSGSYTLNNLLPITEYVVRATVEDKRGNLSAVHPFDIRTTELTAPSVQSIHSYVTAPTYVGFSASNIPDASEMVFVAGILTASTPPITESDVDAHIGSFFSSTIAANTAVDEAVTFNTAFDPANSFTGEPVTEARTYYPFVLYRDAELNVTIQYGPDIYNPDITPPTIDTAAAFETSTDNTLSVSYTISDTVGVTSTKAYVSLMDIDGTTPHVTPDTATVLAQGESVNAAGTNVISNYHSTGNAQPLLHTGKYKVFVAAEDAAGNASEVTSVNANTRDGANPSIDTFDIGNDGSNVSLSWTASDSGPHASVSAVHFISASNNLGGTATAEYIRDNHTFTTQQVNDSTVFDNVPAYYTSYIYGVAEDAGESFGNDANRLSDVNADIVEVPQLINPNTFTAISSTQIEASGASVIAASGPLYARLVVFKDGAPADDFTAALSNALFTSTAHDEFYNITESTDVIDPTFVTFTKGVVSASTVVLNWEVSDSIDPTPKLYIGAYTLPTHPTNDDIIEGTGDNFFSRKVITDATGTISHTYGTSEEGPLIEGDTYYFYAVAEDSTGNRSEILTLNTSTSMVAPTIQSIHDYTTSPSTVGFSVTNHPDTSEMTLIAGVLTASTPLITEPDVDTHIGSFISRSILANTVSDEVFSFNTAHDPSNSFAGEPVREGKTYYPFVFYRDAKSNSVLQYGSDIYNPDITSPSIDTAAAFETSTDNTLSVSYTISDAAGIPSTRAYVSLMDTDGTTPLVTPDAATVLAQGESVNATGTNILTKYHSTGSAEPLLHTGKYKVFVAAEDASSNKSAITSINANTRDGADPVIHTFTLGNDGGSSNVSATWDASDAGPHAAVSAVHFISTSSDLGSVTPEYVRDNHTFTTSQASGSTTFHNIPAYYSSYIYGVAEDSGVSFGNAANRLSDVSVGNIPVPEFAASDVFSQVTPTKIRASGITVTAMEGPLYAKMVLFKDTEPAPLLTASLSDAMINSTGYDEFTNISEGMDTAGPTINSFSISGNTDLSWSITDSVGSTPVLHIAAYDIQSYPTDEEIISGTGNGYVSKTKISDAVGITSYDYNSLPTTQVYYISAVAVDTAGNKSKIKSLATITYPAITFDSFSTGSVIGSTTVDLTWSLSDSVDATPDLHIAAYTVESSHQWGALSVDNIIDGNGTGYLSNTVIPNAAGTTSYSYGTGAEGSLNPGTFYYFYAVVRDSSGNRSTLKDVTAYTSPITFSSFSTGSVTHETVDLAWSLSDSVDATPDLHIAAYTSASSPSADNVIQGTGTGYLSKAVITDAVGTTSYSYLNLDPDTTYYFYAVVFDSSNNKSTVENASASTAVFPITFSSFSTGSVTHETVDLAWSLSDSVDATPDLHIAAYTSASSPSADNVIQGTGTGYLSKAVITDAVGTTSYSYLNLDPDTTYYFYAVVFDSSNNKSTVENASASTAVFPITFSSFSTGSVTHETVDLAWSLSDSVDATPDLHIAAYTSASSPSADNVIQGTGTGYLSKAVITDAVGTTSYSYLNLDPDTTYYFYAVVFDSSNNKSTVENASASTAILGYKEYGSFDELLASDGSYIFDSYGGETRPFGDVLTDGTRDSGTPGIREASAVLEGILHTVTFSIQPMYGKGVSYVFQKAFNDLTRTQGGIYEYNLTNEPVLRQYNGNTTTATDQGYIAGEWVQWYSEEPATYDFYGFSTWNRTIEFMGKWTVAGSNNGNDFTVLDRRTKTSVPYNQNKIEEYPMDAAVGSYKYYRLVWEANIGPSQTTIIWNNVWFGKEPSPITFDSFSTGSVTHETVDLAWSLSDSVDATPDLHIAAYTSASFPSADNVIQGTGTGYLSKTVITDAVGTTSYSYLNLDPDTTYYFYAVVFDSSNNKSTVENASASTAILGYKEYGSFDELLASEGSYIFDSYGGETRPFGDVLADGSRDSGTPGIREASAVLEGILHTVTFSIQPMYGKGVSYVFQKAFNDLTRTQGGIYEYNLTNEPVLRQYNGNTTTATDQGYIAGEWVQWYSEEPATYDFYGFSTWNRTIEFMGKWTVAGSNNGNDFTVLDRRTKTSVPYNQNKIEEYPMDTAVGSYKYYRLVWEANIGPSQTTIIWNNVWFGNSDSPIVVPPNWSSTGTYTATRTIPISDGSSTVTVSGIDASYYIRVRYTATRDGNSGNYSFQGPGINVNSGGDTTSGTNIQGTWQTGQTSYAYNSFVNDFISTAYFELSSINPA